MVRGRSNSGLAPLGTGRTGSAQNSRRSRYLYHAERRHSGQRFERLLAEGGRCMSDQSKRFPPEQQAIQDKCFHSSGSFDEFLREDVETSIPARFEKIVRLYPDRLAVKMGDRALTYDELN